MTAPNIARPTWLLGSGALDLSQFTDAQKQQISAAEAMLHPEASAPDGHGGVDAALFAAITATATAGEADPLVAQVIAHIRGTGPKYENVPVYVDHDGSITGTMGANVTAEQWRAHEARQNPAPAPRATPAANIARNAAGTPLVLIGHADANNPLAEYVNTDDIPLGVNGHVYTSQEVVTLSAAQQQALMNDLGAKYKDVYVDEGNGIHVISLEFEMTAQDDALFRTLLVLGAKRPDTFTDPAAAPAPTPRPVIIAVPATPTTPAVSVVSGVATTPDAHVEIGKELQHFAAAVPPEEHGRFYRFMALLGHGSLAAFSGAGHGAISALQSPIGQELMAIELQKLGAGKAQ